MPAKTNARGRVELVRVLDLRGDPRVVARGDAAFDGDGDRDWKRDLERRGLGGMRRDERDERQRARYGSHRVRAMKKTFGEPPVFDAGHFTWRSAAAMQPLNFGCGADESSRPTLFTVPAGST